jgi:hypothetical protein
MSQGKWQKGKITGDQKIATHEEVLRLLSEQARNGSVTAATALERALRGQPLTDEDLDADLERILTKDDGEDE